MRGLEPQNSYAAISLVPIHRLPVELLTEIFHLSIHCHGYPPLELMRVCRYWRTIILGIPKIWADVRLSTWTQPCGVMRRLKLTGTSLLNVEIDTAADGNEVKRKRKFWGLAKAAREAKRWRNLTITSFPPKGEIDACSLPQYRAFEFVGPMDALESLRIKNPCESSIVFDHLLDVLGSSSHSKLTYMELMSPNAVHRLSQPQFVSIFRHLITFKVDVRDMSSEADILPHFERLETLEASGLCLPGYPADQDLPVVRTLKHIKLKGISIEWMAGREFPMLVECAITWPQQIDALRKGISLPTCTSLTYQGRKPYLLSYATLPQLTSVAVGNSAWNAQRGSEELITPRAEPIGNLGRQWTRLRTLHLDIRCHSESIIAILRSLPTLEELTLDIARPNALGRKFFKALMATESKPFDGTSWSAPLCPSLLTLDLRYRRWTRESETDNITSILARIVESRERTRTPLRSLHIWTSADDAEGTEMCKDASGRDGTISMEV
jgi:hypothetical protein